MSYKCYKQEDKYIIVNEQDTTLNINLNTKEEAVRLKNELNKLIKRVEYQQRVIEKSIKIEKLNRCKLNDYEVEVAKLKQENKILRKIIKELR